MTFLGTGTNVQPDSLLFHVANDSSSPLRLEACRLWLPENNATWRALIAQPWLSNRLDRFPTDGIVPAKNRGGASVNTGPLPLTYATLEVRLVDAAGKPFTVWTHQRIKRELFDISGGWVASRLGSSNTLQAVPYLQTLSRMHINAGMHEHVPGYSDTPLFDKYPLKYMNRMQPFARYDTDSMLPRIHAVEFLGEPQYGGGKPVSPQDCWKAFSSYALFALDRAYTPDPEERVFRFGPPREVTFLFPLPAYLRAPAEIFRVDADGVTQVKHQVDAGDVEIRDRVSRAAIHVVAAKPGERARIETRRQALIAGENALGFDPAGTPADLAVLQEMLRKAEK